MRTRTQSLFIIAAALGFTLPALADDDRITRTSEGYAASDDGGAGTTKTQRVPEADVVTKPRAAKGGESRTQSAVYADHWIYDAWVELEGDLDGDGFFHFVRVRFDADTVYTSAWVFAEIYISRDGAPWELLHATDDFLIEGQVPDDEYEVETELLSGYPRGYYDMLVELYDADYVEYVDEFGPAQSSAMSLLPLEDQESDGIRPPPVVIVDEGGGGAALWLLLLGALLPFVRRGRAVEAPRRPGRGRTGRFAAAFGLRCAHGYPAFNPARGVAGGDRRRRRRCRVGPAPLGD